MKLFEVICSAVLNSRRDITGVGSNPTMKVLEINWEPLTGQYEIMASAEVFRALQPGQTRDVVYTAPKAV